LAGLARSSTDRGRAQLEATSGGPVRLADDEHLVSEVCHAGEQRDPESSRAEERDAPDAH